MAVCMSLISAVLQVLILLDTYSFDVSGSARKCAGTGAIRRTDVPRLCPVIPAKSIQSPSYPSQSLADTVLRFKGALGLKASKEDAFHPELIKATMDVWRQMKVSNMRSSDSQTAKPQSHQICACRHLMPLKQSS